MNRIYESIYLIQVGLGIWSLGRTLNSSLNGKYCNCNCININYIYIHFAYLVEEIVIKCIDNNVCKSKLCNILLFVKVIIKNERGVSSRVCREINFL